MNAKRGILRFLFLLPFALGLLVCTGCILMPVGWQKSGTPQVYGRKEFKRIAILPIGRRTKDGKVDVDQVFMDAFMEQFVERSKWAVINRSSIDKATQELELQQGALFDPDTATRIGKFAGVEMVIFGEAHSSTRYTIKAIEVETATYLSCRYYDLRRLRNPSPQFKAVYCSQSLLPYRIRYFCYFMHFGNIGGQWLFTWARAGG